MTAMVLAAASQMLPSAVAAIHRRQPEPALPLPRLGACPFDDGVPVWVGVGEVLTCSASRGPRARASSSTNAVSPTRMAIASVGSDAAAKMPVAVTESP